MSEEKDIEMQAEEAAETVEEITEEAVEAADEYGIFSFLADMPIFAIEKQIVEETVAVPEPEPQGEVVDCIIPDLVPRDTGAVYDWIYYFGLQIIRRVRHIGQFIKRIFRRPMHAVAIFAGIIFVLLDKVLLKSVRTAAYDIKNFRTELKASLKGKNRVDGKSLFKKHPHAVRTIANTAAPLAAFALLLVTVGYWTGSTYALEVVVDNNGEQCTLGYISDESVFIQARSIVKERIDSGAADEEQTLIANPTYKITRVKLNELSDAHSISDKLIENSDSKLTNACGVYIDGEFICAVKNETDARSVFNNLLSEAEEKYKVDEDDESSFADFVEDVEFVQGLYSDDEDKMWEASKLLDVLTNEKKSEAVYYTVQDGDTPSEIADAYDISYSDLKALNPDVNFDVFKTGTELLVSSEVNFVRVKIIRIIEKNESTPYETEKIETSTLFKGDTRTIRNGVKGTDKVTYLATYIDGVQVSTEEIDRVTLVEPINEKIQVGTKKTSVYGSGYEVITNGKFVWPVSGLYTITSYYGNRRSGWHTGLDISGGNASGKLVLAAESGTVELVKFSNRSYGNQVVINHGNGIKTRYAHMLDGSISVSVGQKVTRGQAIGRVGNTGNSSGAHLHFEVIVNGNTVNPINYIK